VPTYSYACTGCGNRFDAVQAFTDDALTTCQHCSGRLRKLFGTVGVVFKGSGFYHNDSRESAKSSANGSAKSHSSSGADDTSGSNGSDKTSAGQDNTSTSKDKTSTSTSKSEAGSTTAAAGKS
jgi:putative FmdB family regulatory protein